MAQAGSKFQVGSKASQRPGTKVSARASSSPATRTPESDNAFWDEAVVSNKAAATPGGSGTRSVHSDSGFSPNSTSSYNPDRDKASNAKKPKKKKKKRGGVKWGADWGKVGGVLATFLIAGAITLGLLVTLGRIFF